MTASTNQWQNPEQWRAARVGKFTASTIADLFTEPMSLTDEHVAKYGHLIPDDPYVIKGGKKQFAPNYQTKLKGAVRDSGRFLFGATALTRIAKVAAERITGVEGDRITSKAMERGIEMEPYAFAHLNKHWSPLDGAQFAPYAHPILKREIGGATPDFVALRGSMTGDIKIPQTDKVLEFARSVKEGDHDSLMSWSKQYYWQIMMQAKVYGAKKAALAYYDERIAGGLVDYQDFEAGYYKPQLAHLCAVVRTFDLRKEDSDLIDAVLLSAEEQCTTMMDQFANP